MFTKRNNQLIKNYFMGLAKKQAEYMLGNTGRNPAVGCVLVKNNCVISAGHTGYNGRPHAESSAIKIIKGKTKDSCLYVTLEPCSHYGKTPPCVKIISKSGINKVLFSVIDKDLRSKNKSLNYFKNKNIKVNKGISSKEINSFYKSYYKFKEKNLPFVTCKLAVSKDLFSKNTKKKWITNSLSRGRVHLLRSSHDCLVTSYKTINHDNPLLNCRINGLKKRSPKLIILDKDLLISLRSRLFSKENNRNIIIFYNRINKKKIKKLKKMKIRIIKLNVDSENKFNLKEILKTIRNYGYQRVFVESGKNLILEFMKNNLVDDFKLFISEKKISRYGKISIKDDIYFYLKKKKFIVEKVNLFGDSLHTYRMK